MEPAVERREHVDTNRSYVAYLATPQWSPPLNGGSTWPLSGGRGTAPPCRNGARR